MQPHRRYALAGASSIASVWAFGRSMSTVLQAVVPEHGVCADPLGLAWPGPGAEIDGDIRRGYLDRIIRE